MLVWLLVWKCRYICNPTLVNIPHVRVRSHCSETQNNGISCKRMLKCMPMDLSMEDDGFGRALNFRMNVGHFRLVSTYPFMAKCRTRVVGIDHFGVANTHHFWWWSIWSTFDMDGEEALGSMIRWLVHELETLFGWYFSLRVLPMIVTM